MPFAGPIRGVPANSCYPGHINPPNTHPEHTGIPSAGNNTASASSPEEPSAGQRHSPPRSTTRHPPEASTTRSRAFASATSLTPGRTPRPALEPGADRGSLRHPNRRPAIRPEIARASRPQRGAIDRPMRPRSQARLLDGTHQRYPARSPVQQKPLEIDNTRRKSRNTSPTPKTGICHFQGRNTFLTPENLCLPQPPFTDLRQFHRPCDRHTQVTPSQEPSQKM